jgi:hypothetical protein
VIRPRNTLPNRFADTSQITPQTRKFGAPVQFCNWLIGMGGFTLALFWETDRDGTAVRLAG